MSPVTPPNWPHMSTSMSMMSHHNIITSNLCTFRRCSHAGNKLMRHRNTNAPRACAESVHMHCPPPPAYIQRRIGAWQRNTQRSEAPQQAHAGKHHHAACSSPDATAKRHASNITKPTQHTHEHHHMVVQATQHRITYPARISNTHAL